MTTYIPGTKMFSEVSLRDRGGWPFYRLSFLNGPPTKNSYENMMLLYW